MSPTSYHAAPLRDIWIFDCLNIIALSTVVVKSIFQLLKNGHYFSWFYYDYMQEPEKYSGSPHFWGNWRQQKNMVRELRKRWWNPVPVLRCQIFRQMVSKFRRNTDVFQGILVQDDGTEHPKGTFSLRLRSQFRTQLFPMRKSYTAAKQYSMRKI